ncbi:MAG: DUF1028 domain-containing protein [Chitinophagaceae bacterium]|nr:DUF1028 domain-containing protein [Chitinophagaceae bacterium]
MKKTKLFLFSMSLLVSFVLPAHSTWSIIVVDPKTKEIGIAGASCTNSVYGIGAIVPGKGAIVVQAMSNYFARLKGFNLIMADASPDQIMKALMNPDFDPENQQYAVVCLNYPDQPVTYTGSETHGAKGTLTAHGISVQGNTLTNAEELKAVMNAALSAQKKSLPIHEVLMLALEAGAIAGGDKRCGERKASSAFITVVKPQDDRKNPYLNLVVNQTDNTTNAVEALRGKLEDWKKEIEK